MEENSEYFNIALSRFIKDFACGNEIRAKYKNGKSIKKIKEELSFPMSEAEIEKIINDYKTNEKEGK